MPNYQKRIVYLSEEQCATLFSEGTITVNGVTITYSDNDMYVTPQNTPLYPEDLPPVATMEEVQEIIDGYDSKTVMFNAYWDNDAACFISESNASDIAAVFASGKGVVLHIVPDTENEEYEGPDVDAYFLLFAYIPEHEENNTLIEDQFIFADEGLIYEVSDDKIMIYLP